MTLKNKVRNLITKQEITRYRFWKQTGISRSVAYKLCDDPFYIPRTNVIDIICRVFRVQPGDLLEYVPEPEPQPIEESDRAESEATTTEEAMLQEQAHQAYYWDGTAQPITEISLEVGEESDHVEDQSTEEDANATELQDPATTEQQADHGV